MRIFKVDGPTLADLKKGDLFEKNCNNPCTMYMVADADSSRNFSCQAINNGDDYRIVVDLKNSIVKLLPLKEKVTPLEQIDGISVKERL